MPIYAYKCQSCGHAKDVLQKMSDAVLTDCPACGKPEFQKQLTAAGFQLKGSGWYVTDFRGGNQGPGKSAEAAGADAKPDGKAENQATEAAGKPETKPDSAASSPSPAPSAPVAPSTPSVSAP